MPDIRPLPPYEPGSTSARTVTLDVTDSDTQFVLTEALRDFADRQRDLAENDPDSADSRHEWAETADRLREYVEAAL